MKKLETYDIIIPVPISKKREKQRGYNQSLLIAKEIAKQYNKINTKKRIKLNTKSLYKIKDITEQNKLKKEQRMLNIQGAYEIRKVETLKNKKILLVDDIYTTGSTVRECSKILKKGNPKSIGVLTIAMDFIEKNNSIEE